MIEDIELSDGTVLDVESLERYEGNVLFGSSVNDNITAGNTNDTIIGGQGNDRLEGGAGNDVYLFNRGDAQDTIRDNSGSDTIRFGAGITADDVYIRFEQDTRTTANRRHLVMVLKEEGKTFEECSDRILIEEFYYNGGGNGNLVVEHLEFVDGTVLNLADIVNLAGTEGDDYLEWSYRSEREYG
jgi:hypothetical protein